MATLQSLGSVAGLINLDYGKFKYAVDQMRTSADGINGNVEERARELSDQKLLMSLQSSSFSCKES